MDDEFDWRNCEPVRTEYGVAGRGRGRGRQPSQPQPQPTKASSKPKYESAWDKFNKWDWGKKPWSSYSSSTEEQQQHFPQSSMGRGGSGGPSSYSAQSSNHESRGNLNYDGPGPGRANDNLPYFIDCNGSGGSNGTDSSSHEIGSKDDSEWEFDEFDHSNESQTSETPASRSNGVQSRSTGFPTEEPFQRAPSTNPVATSHLLPEVPPQDQPGTLYFHQDLRYGSGPYSQESPSYQDPWQRPGPSHGNLPYSYVQDPRQRPGPSHGDLRFQDPMQRPGPSHGDLPYSYYQDPRLIPTPRQNVPPPPGPQPMHYLPPPQVQNPRPRLVPDALHARRDRGPGTVPSPLKDRPSVQIHPNSKGPGRTISKTPTPNKRLMPPPEKPLSPKKPPPVQPGRSILKKTSQVQSPPDKRSFQVPKPSVTFSLNDIVQPSTPKKISNASSSSSSPKITETRTVASPSAEAGKAKKRPLSEDKEDNLEDFLSKSKNRVSARTYARPAKRASSVAPAPPEENQTESHGQDSTLATDPRTESEGAIENKTDATDKGIVTNNEKEKVDDDPPPSITIRTDIFAEDDDDE